MRRTGRTGRSLLSTPLIEIDGKTANEWLAKSLKTLRAADNVTLMPRTTAIGYFHDNFVALAERLTDHKAGIDVGPSRERLHRIRAGRVILAQGAIERPLVFNGNDRPGVMLASSAQTFLNKYGVAVGNDVAVFTSHDSAYEAAFNLSDSNIRISAIVDVRNDLRADLKGEAEKRGIEIILGAAISKTSGKLRINACEIFSPTTGHKRNINCDALIMSGGWTPSLHLWSHSKGGIKWNANLAAMCLTKPTRTASVSGPVMAILGLKWRLRLALKRVVLVRNS